MKFSEIRPTFVKRTVAHSFLPVDSPATPCIISPFENGTQRLKPGIQISDLFQPLYNRAGRRANGQVRKRSRLRDNPPPAHWLPIRIAQRNMEKMLEENGGKW